jgi:hypothetical protein
MTTTFEYRTTPYLPSDEYKIDKLAKGANSSLDKAYPEGRVSGQRWHHDLYSYTDTMIGIKIMQRE